MLQDCDARSSSWLCFSCRWHRPPGPGAPEGHEIIARIAADNLTPSAHLRISQLLGGDAPALMVLDANWADEIRTDRPQTVPWHFVNIEIGSKGYDPRRDCPHDDCVVAQIDHDVAVLKRPQSAPHREAGSAALSHSLRGRCASAACMPPTGTTRAATALSFISTHHRGNLHGVWDQDVVEALGKDPLPVAAGIEAQFSAAAKSRHDARHARRLGQ